MLRVGLTGGLGSGKSTVARMLAERGAALFSSDEMARAMMQPGQAVYQAIVEQFGPGVVLADGQLDRPALARLAFDPTQPRVEALNAIVHPAVLAAQAQQIAALAQTQPHAIVVVESALILSTRHAGDQPWRTRFDALVVVTAPHAAQLQRFVTRSAGQRDLTPHLAQQLKQEGARRLALQQTSPEPDDAFAVIANDGDLQQLAVAVEDVWQRLLVRAQAAPTPA